MLKRTPSLAILITAVMSILIILIFEEPSRPFTSAQSILLFLIAFFPGMGIAMLFDPHPAEVKAKYLKINFYDPDKTAEEMVEEIFKNE